jgi:hypothetical protein
MHIEPVFSGVISELFVNLAAGWLGVVFIVPNFLKVKGKQKWLMLITDVLFAIVCLILAVTPVPDQSDWSVRGFRLYLKEAPAF